MTVRELVKRLLEEDMNTEVVISVDDKHINENGEEMAGYAFNIDGVRKWGCVVELVFTDRRKGNKK